MTLRRIPIPAGEGRTVPRGPKPAARWVLTRHKLGHIKWAGLRADVADVYRAAYEDGRRQGLLDAARLVREAGKPDPEERGYYHGVVFSDSVADDIEERAKQ